jgi:hypothetical protein
MIGELAHSLVVQQLGHAFPLKRIVITERNRIQLDNGVKFGWVLSGGNGGGYK